MLKDPGRQPQPNRRKPAAEENKTAATNERKLWTLRSTPNIRTKQIRPLSATSRTVGDSKGGVGIEKKIKRPATVYGDNVSLRRGPTHHKGEGQSQTPEDLSRASSTTTLNPPPIKPKKSESKEKLNKLKSRTNDLDVVETLQKQLAEMAEEKNCMVVKLSEQSGQLRSLQEEVDKLRTLQDESSVRCEQLVEENTVLRNRLRDVAHSPLSDNEKQQLLFENHRHHSSSAPASIATNLPDDGGDITACPTPEWDKHSSGNVSEISVACLQDKINQMQETHYSTNEELQATLQELTDLQKQLYELQQENVRLNEEKNLMFESLCRQTERLNDARNEVESLKQLLYRDETKQYESAAEREQKLVDLLKSAQEERESLLVKQEQLTVDLEESRTANTSHVQDIGDLRNRVQTLESTLDAKHAEHKQIDQELALARDQSSSRQIEINRLKDVLDSARAKVHELEQDRALADKSELDELIDNVRKEKDLLEADVTDLKERLALSKNETDKLREQVSVLQEECKVLRNNARKTQSDLEYKLEKLQGEKIDLQEQLVEFQEVINSLQVQNQCQLDDKRQLSSVLAETQRNLNESEGRVEELEAELAEVKRQKFEQEEEWEKFQNDLLTSVRVANDFKTEAQQNLEKLILENKTGRDKIRQLELQIEKLKAESSLPPPPPPPMRPTNFDELSRRPKLSLSRQNSRQSVKSLIESIENAAKGAVSRSSSASSIASMDRSPTISPTTAPSMSPGSPLRNDWSDVKTPLKEQTPNKLNWTGKSNVIDKGDLGKTKTDETPSYRTKTIEYNRRNSYSDLSERKDPLNGLVKNGGSKRNALLKWCQNKTVGYRNIDITNFSSSWNDGLALCALLHTYLPDRIPYDSLTPQEKRRNFSLAFAAAESVGIPTSLNINDMIQLERPDWQQVMSYVTAIYKHFET